MMTIMKLARSGNTVGVNTATVTHVYEVENAPTLIAVTFEKGHSIEVQGPLLQVIQQLSL